MAERSYKLQEFVAHASNVKCLNIGKKSCRTFVTGGEDKMVNIWAVGKPKCLFSLSGHTSPVESVTFDSSEALVLAGASTGIIKLWDLEEPKAVRTLSGHRSKCSSLEFHPFGEFLASGSSDADIKIWDTRKKGCIHTYKGHTRGITTIRFTPDGRWLVSGGEDNVIKLWDLTAGKLLHDFKFHTGAIRSIDFHPHEFLLATGSADKTVRFWDLETFELIGSAGPEATAIRSMIFHPDGKTLFSGLEQKLKVFSWEPVRCHDDIDIGWSVLGDLTIYEGKLLGCSYYENSVGVWVVDLSMVGPYATGGFSISSAFMEPEFKIMVNHNLSSVSSHPDDPDDQQIDTKEIIHTECSTYKLDEMSQQSSGRTGSIRAPKGSEKGLAESKGKKDVSGCLGSQKSDKISRTKPSKNGDPTDVKAGNSRTNGSNFSKGTRTRSSGLRGSSILSNLKKDSMLDKHRGVNAQVNKMICTPVVVMRDIPDVPKSPKIHNGTSLQEMDVNDNRLCKLSHVPGSSSANVGKESNLVTAKHGSVGRSSDGAHVALDRPPSRGGIIDSKVKNDGIKTSTGSFQRVSFLDPSFDFRRETGQESSHCTLESNSAKCDKADQESCCRTSESNSANGVKDDLDSQCCTTEEKSVKVVRGVAVQHGRTRSLVESWEKRERFGNICTSEVDSSVSMTAQTTHPSIPPKEPTPSPHKDPVSEDDAFSSSLLQSRDQFINALKSRLTKLQMVRHCWEQNGIKGAINSIAKLPDLPVQVDVMSILIEKANLLTLEFFSSLLPILVGLLHSKTERHIDISLEMLLKLVKLLWPVVHSTVSSHSPIGIDIEAEERANRCRQIFDQFEKIREILPLLIRQGGIIARRSLELNLALQC